MEAELDEEVPVPVVPRGVLLVVKGVLPVVKVRVADGVAVAGARAAHLPQALSLLNHHGLVGDLPQAPKRNRPPPDRTVPVEGLYRVSRPVPFLLEGQWEVEQDLGSLEAGQLFSSRLSRIHADSC